MSIESIKKKSLEEHIPIIMDDTLEVIKEILIKEKPARILEIGTATGYSSICFATILLENCIDEDSSSILIDTIELDEERASEAIKNIKEMNLTNTINVFIGNAVEILPTFNEKYDIIKRRENNEMEDKELFSTYDRLTAEQFPFFRKYIPEYEYDINKEESWQTLKIAMTSNTLESDEPLKEDVLESKVPKNDEGR